METTIQEYRAGVDGETWRGTVPGMNYAHVLWMIRHEVCGNDFPTMQDQDEIDRRLVEWLGDLHPHIGCGVTITVGSDRYPAEVVQTKPGKSRTRIWIRRMDSRCISTSGVGCTEHEFMSRPDGEMVEVRFSKAKKCWMYDGRRVSFNGAQEYRDPHF